MLGRERPPVFVHHGLLLNSGGEKLSKSSGDTGVRELRAAGVSPAVVIGRAAAWCTLIDTPRPIPAAEVAGLLYGRVPQVVRQAFVTSWPPVR